MASDNYSDDGSAFSVVSPYGGQLDLSIDIKHADEYPEDYGIPAYLVRKPNATRTMAQDMAIEAMFKGHKCTLKTPPPVRKWRSVENVNYNAWREKNFDDNGSIYSVRSEVFAPSHELPPEIPSSRSFQEKQRTTNFQTVEEKQYLSNAKNIYKDMLYPDFGNDKRFLRYIMKEYKKPKRTKTPTYCLPIAKNPTKKSLSAMNEEDIKKMFSKNTSVIALNKQKWTEVQCSADSDAGARKFCDVLGTVSCNACIEHANRENAKKAETTFKCPEYTPAQMVGPTLSKVLSSGLNYSTKNSRRGPRNEQKTSGTITYILPPLLRIPRTKKNV